MKKQLFLITLFIFAIFAITNEAKGQAVKWSDPRVLSCEDDALHPIAGKEYTYTAVGLPAGGAWRFWATKDPNFITAPSGAPVFNTGTALEVIDGELLYASDDYNIEIGISDPNENGDGSIQLRWSSKLLANTVYQTNPTFVVAYYLDANGCTDNIKVWELDPMNGFTVDIIAMDRNNPTNSQDAYDVIPEDCVSPVESATYAAGSMVYDYGEDYLYFEFIAANFTGHWIPHFELTGLNGSQTITSYEYTFATPDTWDATTTWTTLVSGTTPIAPDASVANTTEEGVSIFVRVLVDHLKWEHIAENFYTMTLDGINADGQWDVVNDGSTNDCDDPGDADLNDTADWKITPRPEIPEDQGTTSPTNPNIQIISGDNEN